MYVLLDTSDPTYLPRLVAHTLDGSITMKMHRLYYLILRAAEQMKQWIFISSRLWKPKRHKINSGTRWEQKVLSTREQYVVNIRIHIIRIIGLIWDSSWALKGVPGFFKMGRRKRSKPGEKIIRVGSFRVNWTHHGTRLIRTWLGAGPREDVNNTCQNLCIKAPTVRGDLGERLWVRKKNKNSWELGIFFELYLNCDMELEVQPLDFVFLVPIFTSKVDKRKLLLPTSCVYTERNMWNVEKAL